MREQKQTYMYALEDWRGFGDTLYECYQLNRLYQKLLTKYRQQAEPTDSEDYVRFEDWLSKNDKESYNLLLLGEKAKSAH